MALVIGGGGSAVRVLIITNKRIIRSVVIRQCVFRCCVYFDLTYLLGTMNHVANVVRKLVGGEGSPFKTQVELCERAGFRPSTLNGVLKSAVVGSETLGKLLECVSKRWQEELLAAAVRDAVPAGFVGLLFDEDGQVSVPGGGEGLSVLAERYLVWLRGEARRDPMAERSLETQARWVGLDKV